MEIFEALDATECAHSAAALAGVDPKTVRRYARMRDAGRPTGGPVSWPKVIDPFMPKIEEWVERSQGTVRADKLHERLQLLGFAGDERTTRRAVAKAKERWRAGHRRTYRPWITEPGLWLQFDWGCGPKVPGPGGGSERETLLFCAWLAWSRFRVVIPVWERTLPTVISCLDSTLRAIGGAPTYVLTDNEKTMTIDRVAGIAVRRSRPRSWSRGDRGPVRRGRLGVHRPAPPARHPPRRPRRRRRDAFRPARHIRLGRLRPQGHLIHRSRAASRPGTGKPEQLDAERQLLMTTTAVADPPEVVPAPSPVPPSPIPAELEAVLKRMRFPYLRRAAPEVLATARSQRWDPAEVVRILLEKIKGRDEATRRNHRQQAQLPSGKTFDSWREADSSIPAPTQQALMTLEWVARAENLAVAGPSGTGKSHLAEALANKAIDEGMKVAWFTLESLTAHLGRATVDNTVSKAVAKITRCDLIVVDDIGMLPSGQAAAEAFYRVIDAAYERRSVMVTSNLHPSGFDSIMPKTLATAAVDRLLHHAHIVLTEGSSLRLTQATTGQGVVPLNQPGQSVSP
ncbi:IS21-like element helper ATPase IstB [Streptomyces sp. NPDC045431]|uniref:IS21-like element helper ATPase IstB n=1 Tax=Streptomyces sp. NPDC045431 TaxID=3155613 RepID=UPI0033D371AE